MDVLDFHVINLRQLRKYSHVLGSRFINFSYSQLFLNFIYSSCKRCLPWSKLLFHNHLLIGISLHLHLKHRQTPPNLYLLKLDNLNQMRAKLFWAISFKVGNKSFLIIPHPQVVIPGKMKDEENVGSGSRAAKDEVSEPFLNIRSAS